MILGRDIHWCDLDLTTDFAVVALTFQTLSQLYLGVRYATLQCDLDLSFDLAIVTLTFKILSVLYISETVRCRKLTLGRDIGWGDVGVQCHCVTLI